MEYNRFTPSEYTNLPHEPGIYKFLNKKSEIIYVGKAKDLLKRVSSYFSLNATNRKTYKLVTEIANIEYVVVNSEFDALLLENSLIKENQPKYNILLKDDKSFPSICVTFERFPRVYSTRRLDPEIGLYFGPYTSVKAMDNVLDLIRKLCKIRTCTYDLSQKNIEKKKYKVCLEYHLGNCKGPCEGLQTEEDYTQEIKGTYEILKGNLGVVKSEFKAQMDDAAATLNFEQAQTYKTKIELLDRFQIKSTIVNPRIGDVDVFGVVNDEESFYINYLRIEFGSIKISETFEIKRKIEEAEEDLLQMIVFNARQKYTSHSKEILSNRNFQIWDDLELTLPKIGDKKKLVDLSVKNALIFKNDKLLRGQPKENRTNKILIQLQKDLNLKDLPNHIECFDNSNIQGTNPVASMVCFKSAKPSKKDYRKFNIKTVTGPDDFSSMKEIVGRRYFRLREEQAKFPDLIVVDGGKGQLSSACEALKELGIYGMVPIIGIAKRLEEIYYPEDSIPLHISKKSPSLKLLQHLRDEAHRFAITFHRDKRSKASIKSALDDIKGIGESTKKTLLSKFKSIKRIQSASHDELQEVVGTHKAILIEAFFAQKAKGG